MNRKIVFIIVLFMLATPLVSAKDITISLDQSEYYFTIGEDAIINLQSENTYKEQINGMLSYTITQSINQGNFQYSSSNTKSTSFSVDKGETQIPISFGTSDTPMTLAITLQFSYTKDELRIVNLDNIKIHFVSDESQKNNQQNQVSSSSQVASESTQQQNDPFAQQEQRMQQMIDQMFGNQQQQQPQSAQQKLQNNQLSQDSSALKQQMEKQIQEQQQMKEEFQKSLAQNQEFQKEHQELLNQGYNLTNANFNPSSNNTGNFELEYQKPNGEEATLQGQMNNGEIQNIQKYTAELRQQMMDKLQENKQFQEYQKQLQEQGYLQQDMHFTQEQNKTNVQLNYMNQNNETASITAEIVNNTVQNVELQNGEKEKKNYWWVLPVIILLALVGYFAYKKLHQKPEPESVIKKKIEKPYDYKKESLKLLEKSKKEFAFKKYKDAYGTAGQALRLYLSYENKLNKEITNDELIDYLKQNKKSHKEIKECFDLCSLVEFAKYEANKKDFERIIDIATNIIA
ncbi:DUF4175 domain-containing protein [Candidatus Woesearchaeota archaeon]|nr:DUF4175 domain-containing protein [Candidatus Woesearchaeota archaeon]